MTTTNGSEATFFEIERLVLDQKRLAQVREKIAFDECGNVETQAALDDWFGNPVDTETLRSAIGILGEESAFQLYESWEQEQILGRLHVAANVYDHPIPELDEYTATLNEARRLLHSGRDQAINVGFIGSTPCLKGVSPDFFVNLPFVIDGNFSALLKDTRSALVSLKEKVVSNVIAWNAGDSISCLISQADACIIRPDYVTLCRCCEEVAEGVEAKEKLGSLVAVEQFLRDAILIKSVGVDFRDAWGQFVRALPTGHALEANEVYFQFAKVVGLDTANRLLDSLLNDPNAGIRKMEHQLDGFFGSVNHRSRLEVDDNGFYLVFKGERIEISERIHFFISEVAAAGNDGVSRDEIQSKSGRNFGPQAGDGYKKWQHDFFRSLKNKGINPTDILEAPHGWLGKLYFRGTTR